MGRGVTSVLKLEFLAGASPNWGTRIATRLRSGLRPPEVPDWRRRAFIETTVWAARRSYQSPGESRTVMAAPLPFWCAHDSCCVAFPWVLALSTKSLGELGLECRRFT
jgi:hypothetical protein